MNENPFSGAVDTAPSSSSAATDLRAAAGDFARVAGEHVAGVKERAIEVAGSIKSGAIEKASHLKEVATEKAEHYKTVACEKVGHAKEVAQVQWRETSERAKELHVTAEDYIKQNPTKAVLGAMGVGFLIGLIMRR